MIHRAVFRFRSPFAGEIYRAVAPELAGEEHARSRAECWMEGPDILVLSIGATDLSALRASLNMWLRLVSVAEEMKELIKSRESSMHE